MTELRHADLMLEGGGNSGHVELASRNASNSGSSGNGMKNNKKNKKVPRSDKEEGICASLCSCFSKNSSHSNQEGEKPNWEDMDK